SHVASRSTAVSNSGFKSVKMRSCSASHANVTSSSPRRFSNSSIPRSVKYIGTSPLLGRREDRVHQGLLLHLVPLGGTRGRRGARRTRDPRSEEHTSELQSRENLVCRLLLEKKNK